eukprot:7308496-Prymnesium_polylepis.1
MTYMRTVVIPFFQHHEIGVALFVIELWYLHIGLLKGIARLVTACQNVVLSSFTPHRCIFPDGMESADSAHVAFVCYVMERREYKATWRHPTVHGEHTVCIA